MVDYTGDDTTQGEEVKWYRGGAQKTETITVTETDVTNTYIALAAKAEFASVQLKVGDIFTACEEYSDTAGAVAATDDTGTQSIKYTGIEADQVLTIYYLDISEIPLTHVAMSRGVKPSWSSDTKKVAVDGQKNKIKASGAMEETANLEAVYYNQSLVTAFCGTQVTDANGDSKWSTKYEGFKKVGALVGKRTRLGVIDRKWFLYGVQPESMDKDFPTEDFYKESFKLLVDDHLEWQKASA